MIFWLIFIVICYSVLMLFFIIGFDKVRVFTSQEIEPKTTFSIIVPFRNEADNLPLLLQSIATLNYPKALFEIIFVNDASSDVSVEIIESFSKRNRAVFNKGLDCARPDSVVLANQRTSNSPKKDAITTAIQQAKNNWIITTDADCILPENWLQTFNNFIQKKQPKMLVAPVTYQANNSFFNRFQLLDFLSLQGATIGGFGINKPFLCNGANLAYLKADFLQLNGFEGNNNIASGDDIFLFEKFVKAYPKQVQFVKSNQVIVKTFPVKTMNNLIHQRVRWASKSGNYQLGFGKLVGSIVFLTNLSLVVLCFSTVFQLVSYQQLVVFFGVKLLLDFSLFLKTAAFFGQKKEVYQSFLLSSVFYPFFSVVVVFMALFSSYQWKGRSFRK